MRILFKPRFERASNPFGTAFGVQKKSPGLPLVAIALLVALLPFAATAQAPVTLQMDKSFIRFVSKQMNVAVEGRFKKFTANLSYDAKKPEASKAEFEVDLGSIDLGTAEADTEVKRKTWFNTDAFPRAKFVSSSVKSLGGDRIEVTGPLLMCGR